MAADDTAMPVCCMCNEEPAEMDVGPNDAGEPLPVCSHCLKRSFDDFFAEKAKKPH